MKIWLVHRDAALRVDTVIDVMIMIAARAHADAFGVCIADLDSDDGQRFAAALHRAEPHGPDTAEIDPRRTGVTWCSASSLGALAKAGDQLFQDDDRCSEAARQAGDTTARGDRMTLWRGAVLSHDAAIRAAIEMTARDHRPGTFAVCFVDLGDVDGQRVAAALHRASPHGPDPASLACKRPFMAWCRCASLATIADVAGEVLGAEMCAAVHVVNRAGAVPVVLVIDRVAMVRAFPAPQWNATTGGDIKP